jgi:hypothetical protein
MIVLEILTKRTLFVKAVTPVVILERLARVGLLNVEVARNVVGIRSQIILLVLVRGVVALLMVSKDFALLVAAQVSLTQEEVAALAKNVV